MKKSPLPRIAPLPKKPFDHIQNIVSSYTADGNQNPIVLIIDPDHVRADSYAESLKRQYSVKRFRFGDEASNYEGIKPAAIIINSAVGEQCSAEETIAALKEKFPDAYVLAVMKCPIDSSYDKNDIFENLMVAGADHVVSRYDLGESFKGIVEALEIAMQGRLKAYDYSSKVNGELKQTQPYKGKFEKGSPSR